MKKLIALLLAALMLLSLAACAAKPAETKTEAPAKTEEPAKTEQPAETEEAPAAAEGKYDVTGLENVTIVFATANAAANIESIYANRFMELGKDYSNGQIAFDYTEGGVMGTQLELVEGTMYGTYNMTCTAIDNFQSWVPEVSVSSMPNLIDSYEMAEKVFDGDYGTQIAEKIKNDTGIEILNYEWCGFRNVCSKKEIKTVDDAKGVLIRVPEVDTYIAFADLTGFSGVTMSWSEAYTAMNSGIIEAVEVPLQNIYEQGFYDLGTNILMTRHIFNTNSIMINADFLAGLPEVYQQIIRDAAKDATLEEREACQVNEQDYLTKLQEKGCTINEWDSDSYAQLQEIFTSYWQEKATGINDQAVSYLDTILSCK